ncbi:MAG: hypothetical protein R3265_10165 [Hyphomonas sp.]|nr:hypothetical protein [Hyphomonas sp.]
MDRQTLDMEGARRGEISSASLQMGEDTIAIQCIATMSVESMEFAPWDTATNRRSQSLYASFFVINLFFGLMALAWGGLFPGNGSSMVALVIGGVLTLLGFALGIRAAVIARRMKKRQPYYRLVIGASDGRQIPLVDNNRDVLMRIRDVVRHKMDSGDRAIRGDFDLDLDLVNLNVPTEAEKSKATSIDPDIAPDPKRHTPDVAPELAETESEVLFDQDPKVVRDAS